MRHGCPFRGFLLRGHSKRSPTAHNFWQNVNFHQPQTTRYPSHPGVMLRILGFGFLDTFNFLTSRTASCPCRLACIFQQHQESTRTKTTERYFFCSLCECDNRNGDYRWKVAKGDNWGDKTSVERSTILGTIDTQLARFLIREPDVL